MLGMSSEDLRYSLMHEGEIYVRDASVRDNLFVYTNMCVRPVA